MFLCMSPYFANFAYILLHILDILHSNCILHICVHIYAYTFLVLLFECELIVVHLRMTSDPIRIRPICPFWTLTSSRSASTPSRSQTYNSRHAQSNACCRRAQLPYSAARHWYTDGGRFGRYPQREMWRRSQTRKPEAKGREYIAICSRNVCILYCEHSFNWKCSRYPSNLYKCEYKMSVLY